MKRVKPLNTKPKIDQEFYNSKAWRKCRAYKLQLDPLCQCKDNCGQLAEVVHHIIDSALRPDLRLTLSNLLSLTKEHHDAITNERRG